MYPANIEDYQRPASLQEAVAILRGYEPGDAIFMAGGQSVMQAMKSRMVRPRCVVDLQAIAELKGITVDEGLRIGAMTRYVEIAGAGEISSANAALRDAARHVGDRQVRNRGTIGGSCCWNYVASCMPAVTLGLGAAFHLLDAQGKTRVVNAGDFFLGPLETARTDHEVLTHLVFDAAPRTGSAYRKWGLVTDALPVVGVCMKVSLDAAGRCSAARMSLSGLPAGAQRVQAGEKALLGSDGSRESVARAMEAVVDAVECHTDKWADANYRQQLIRTLGQEVAATAFARARGEA